MFKTRLQELCHRNLWALPCYTTIKDGPDHPPRFRASVLVNGLCFSSSVLYSSSKEAQNEAARLAFIHFTPPSSTHLPNTTLAVSDASNTFPDPSSQQKRQKTDSWKNLYSPSFPFATVTTLDPDYGPHCKAPVMVDRCRFGSLESLGDQKQEEVDAARAVLDSLSLDSGSQEDTGFYKNRLQELVQREGLALPCYQIIRAAASATPTFYCNVEIDGEIFQGQGAKCKKQAANNAAEVAYNTLIEDLATQSLGKMKGLNIEDEPVSSLIIMHNEKYRGSGGNAQICSYASLNLSLAAKAGNKKEDKISVCHTDHLASSPTTIGAGLSALSLGDSSFRKNHEVNSYLLCGRVRVYSCIPDMLFPKGMVILQVSEDKWVAVSLEFPNEKGK